jgi:hypothetical protein
MLRVFFNAIALVLGLAWIGEASAQSSLPPCPPVGYVWDGCIGTYTSRRGWKYVGEWRDNTFSGQGTSTSPEGEKYVGQWRDYQRSGKGTLTFPNGSKYVGQWKDDMFNGQGTYTSRWGYKYVGQWKDDHQNGQGTETWPNGSKYVGEFRDDKENGRGTYTEPDGSKYVGEWKDDQRNGQGTQTDPDSSYVGEWKDERYNGQGTLTFSDGSKYVGEWRDGKENGQGTFTWPEGEKYVGEFRDDRRNGHGTYTFADGRTYVGEFRDNKFNGHGTLAWPEGKGRRSVRDIVELFQPAQAGEQPESRWPRGDTYVGDFEDNEFNGHGTYTYADGAEYVGEWRDSLKDGQGTFTLPGGAKYIGAWQADKKHGQGKQYSSNGELVHEGYWVSDEYYGSKAPDSLRVENGGRVKMVESGGIYHVPVVINDTLKLDFIVDSGATDVCIPADVALTLMRTGSIKKSDFIGTETYRLADGSAVSSRTFIIRSLTVGDRTVTDVRASIAEVNGDLLLGQSFLSKFKSCLRTT